MQFRISEGIWRNDPGRQIGTVFCAYMSTLNRHWIFDAVIRKVSPVAFQRFFPNDLSLGFSNPQLRAHLESDRRPQTPCPLGARWRNAGGTLVERRWPVGGPLVARFDIIKIGLYLEMVMSIIDDLSVD